MAYHALMWRAYPWLLMLTLSVACKPSPSAGPAPRPDARIAAMVEGVPHVRQEPGLGGEACLEMVLRRAGWALTQQDLFRLSEVDTSASGCYVGKLARILETIGFGHQLVQARGTGALGGAGWRALVGDLRRGQPTLVCVRARDAKNNIDVERFRLVVGTRAGQVVFHDPGRADGASRTMAVEQLLRRWTGTRLRFTGARPVTGKALPPTARLVRQMNALSKELPAGVTLAVEPPFLVAGDEAPVVVRARARTTVRWATRRLKEAYGFSDPDRAITVWLARDAASYGRQSLRLFNAAPISPYGFYSGRLGVILLNASLGSGTVVHELVHALTAASFPNIPTWFDEGLGSLYEACGERSGRIHGYINWRLPGLKRAIRARKLYPFEKLMALSHAEFTHDDTSDRNYAQARFLCYYLQQQGKLRAYYRRFRSSRGSDPAGVRSLKQVLKIRNLAAFQRRWERWVLGLRDAGGFDADLGSKRSK